MRLKENVFEAIKNDGRFKILTKIIENAGIAETMSEEEKAFTFFAPTDEAFSRLSEKAIKILTGSEGKGVIAAIIGQHLIPGNYLYSNDLRKKDTVKTLYGNELKITNQENTLQLENAHILTPGIAAANAVIFPIDKVLPARIKSVISTKH